MDIPTDEKLEALVAMAEEHAHKYAKKRLKERLIRIENGREGIAAQGLGRLYDYPEHDLSEFYCKLIRQDNGLYIALKITKKTWYTRRKDLDKKIKLLGEERSGTILLDRKQAGS